MKANLFAKCFVRVFVGFSLLSFLGCNPDNETIELPKVTIEMPNVFITVSAKNNTTQEETEIKYEGYYQKSTFTIHYGGKVEVITDKNTIKPLYCNPGDVIVFSYYIYLDEKYSSWSFMKINNIVTGLDWEKTFSYNNFSFSLTVPELTSGKYPVTCQTMYELKKNGSGEANISNTAPIETSIILVVP